MTVDIEKIKKAAQAIKAITRKSVCIKQIDGSVYCICIGFTDRAAGDEAWDAACAIIGTSDGWEMSAETSGQGVVTVATI